MWVNIRNRPLTTALGPEIVHKKLALGTVVIAASLGASDRDRAVFLVMAFANEEGRKGLAGGRLTAAVIQLQLRNAAFLITPLRTLSM